MKLDIEKFFREQKNDSFATFATQKKDYENPFAPTDFYAETTYKEKLWRIFNLGLDAYAAIKILERISTTFSQSLSALLIYIESQVNHTLSTILDGKVTSLLEKASPAAARIFPIFIRCLKLLPILLIVRKVVAMLTAMRYVYPATLSYFILTNKMRKSAIEQIEKMKAEGYLCRRVQLEKSGATFEGYLIGHKDIIFNGNWTIHALGSNQCVEQALSYAKENKDHNSNTLLINGPGVARSKPPPTRFSFGAAFESGIQFLENVIKAKKIVMDGFSLGGGMMSEAILQHDFSKGLRQDIRYMNVTRESFDTLSNIARQRVGFSIIAPILKYGLGLELDSIAAAEKLSALNIKHIVINKPCFDDAIPKANALSNNLNELKNRILLTSMEITHCDAGKENYPEEVGQLFKKTLDDFFDKGLNPID